MQMYGRALVTGGGGFIGYHAVKWLARKFDTVIALDDLSRASRFRSRAVAFSATENWNDLGKIANVVRVKGDVRDPSVVRRVTRDATVVIHAAGQVAVTTSLTDPLSDFGVNASGTLQLLDNLRRYGDNSSVVYLSTNKVYGSRVNDVPCREEATRYSVSDSRFRHGIPESFPVDGCEHSPYGVSKLAADFYVQEYAHTYGLHTAAFRMSCIYGERQSGNEDQGWVAHFVSSILNRRPLVIYGDGKQVRDVLHVSDLIRAMALAVTEPSRLRGQVFNIGGGPRFSISLLELLEMVRRQTGVTVSPKFAPWREADQKVYVSDTRFAKRELGWVPKVSPSTGVAKMIAWQQRLGR